MPHIEPFRGILYNPKKVEISKVVAPPYDVISPEMQDELYRADEHNIVRLILGKEEPGDSKTYNKYNRAKKFFKTWLRSKILIQDREPCVYIYSQEYLYGGRKKRRLGFIARMKIEDPRTRPVRHGCTKMDVQGVSNGASKVLPHEYTFSRPKEDRLNLIKEVKANLSSIFTLFQDEKGRIKSIFNRATGTRPVLALEYEWVRHKLWKLSDKVLIKKIQGVMRDKDIFIADGHHRYEVALMYRDEMRKKEGRGTRDVGRGTNKGYDYVMMYFSPLRQEGMTILSTHRLLKCVEINIDKLLKDLETYFYIATCKAEKILFKKMGSVKKEECVFGIYFKNRPFYFLKLKGRVHLDEVIKEDKSREWKRLDVSILHGVILDNILGLREKVHNEECIVYTRDTNYAISEVKKGNCRAAFFLNPTKVAQVQNIARRGDKMPHKSTYFYPKLLSGLVINKL